jgi:hypothetical protein
MPEDCRSLLPDDSLLIKGIREKEVDGRTGRIKKAAFIPRRNGNDDDGLSASQPANDNRNALKIRLRNAEGFFCKFQAGNVRSIREEQATLDVCPDPTEWDMYHVLITGVPATLEQSRLANRLAERLAGISLAYDPPET